MVLTVSIEIRSNERSRQPRSQLDKALREKKLGAEYDFRGRDMPKGIEAMMIFPGAKKKKSLSGPSLPGYVLDKVTLFLSFLQK